MPRLRTTGSAITSSASRKTGKCSRSSSDSSRSTWRVSAPIADLVALLADVRELRQVVDVDQVRGVREPQLHHRQQAVAAGDDARVRAERAAATRSRRRRSSPARTQTVLGSASGSLVLDGRVGADDRRARQPLRARLADLGVERARGQAAAGHVAQDRAADRARARRSAPRGRAARASACPSCRPRRSAARVIVGALREVAEARPPRRPGRGRRRGRRVAQPGLLDEQALERVDAGVEVGVDVVDDRR